MLDIDKDAAGIDKISQYGMQFRSQVFKRKLHRFQYNTIQHNTTQHNMAISRLQSHALKGKLHRLWVLARALTICVKKLLERRRLADLEYHLFVCVALNIHMYIDLLRYR